MSRVANNPVVVPEKVEVTISDDNVLIKGPLGEMRQELKGQVEIKKEENSSCLISPKGPLINTLSSDIVTSTFSGTTTGLFATLDMFSPYST